MGPRSIDRGIGVWVEEAANVSKLQWGRDQLIAELPQPATPGRLSGLLQWGRDQLIAEFPIRARASSPARSFNGAAIN